jgi:hypothetical protein
MHIRNNRKKLQEEYTVSMKDAVWSILEQWKAVLIFAVIIGLLAAGAKEYKDMRSYRAAVKAAAKTEQNKSDETAKDLFANGLDGFKVKLNLSAADRRELGSLSADERQDVYSLLQQKANYEAFSEYYSKSPLMQVNPSEEKVLKLSYLVRIPSESQKYAISTLLSLYQDALSTEDSAKLLNQNLGLSLETRYSNELYQVTSSLKNPNHSTAGDSTLKEAVLYLEILLPEKGADTDKLAQTVTQYLKKTSAGIRKKTEAHTIKLLSAEPKTIADPDLENMQADMYSDISTLATSIKSGKAALNTSQSAVYESIAGKIGSSSGQSEVKDQNSENSGGTEISKPSFSKKYAAAGFVLGILIYCVIFCVLQVSRKKVTRLDLLDEALGIPSLGETRSAEKYHGLRRLFHSRRVYRKRYRHMLAEQGAAQRIADRIASLAQFHQAEQVTFALPDRMNPDSRKELEKICCIISESAGIEVRTLNLYDTVSEKYQDAVRSSENLVLTVCGGTTTCGELDRCIAELDCYDRTIWGAICIDC